jgi:hypothetical protein
MSLYINQQKFLEENPEARTVTQCKCGELHYVGDACENQPFEGSQSELRTIAEQPFEGSQSELRTIAEQPFEGSQSELRTIDKESKIRNLRKKRREERLAKKDQHHLH